MTLEYLAEQKLNIRARQIILKALSLMDWLPSFKV